MLWCGLSYFFCRLSHVPGKNLFASKPSSRGRPPPEPEEIFNAMKADGIAIPAVVMDHMEEDIPPPPEVGDIGEEPMGIMP
jgi:hypothetical protein